MTTAAVRSQAMPSRIRALPRDHLGRPIPWFVADLDDGRRDFRIADPDRRARALRDGLCWVCGQRLPRSQVFIIGPMCTINRITAEPPNHNECAEYSSTVCPFILRPQMTRRTSGLPDNLTPLPGNHVEGNPGGMVLWTTGQWSTFRPRFGMPGGVLVNIGEPTRVRWCTEGRPATRAEAAKLLIAGYARLQEEAGLDPHPPSALEALGRQYARARALLPPT